MKMILVKIVQCVLWLVIVPIILGMLLTRKMKKYENSLLLPFILGYMIEFGVFEYLSIPLDFVTKSFYSFFFIWLVIVLILIGLSVFFNIKRFKKIIEINLKNIKKYQ